MRKILILILLISHASLSFCYITSIGLWKKGDKQVAVLGDVHLSGKEDVCHKQSLIPFLEELAKQQALTEFILEHQQEKKVKFDKNLKCLAYLSRYAYDHNLKHGSLEFNLADIRRIFPSFNQLSHVHNLVADMLYERSEDKIIFELKWLKKNSISAKKLFDDLDFIVTPINKFKLKSKNIQARQFFDDMIKKISELKNMRTIFEPYNKELIIETKSEKYTLPAGSIAASLLGPSAQYNYSKPFLNSLLKFQIEPIRISLADVFFVESMIKSQERVNNSILYIGHGHAATINKLLISLDYNLIYEVGDVFFKVVEESGKFGSASLKDLDTLFRLFMKNMEIK